MQQYHNCLTWYLTCGDCCSYYGQFDTSLRLQRRHHYITLYYYITLLLHYITLPFISWTVCEIYCGSSMKYLIDSIGVWSWNWVTGSGRLRPSQLNSCKEGRISSLPSIDSVQWVSQRPTWPLCCQKWQKMWKYLMLLCYYFCVLTECVRQNTDSGVKLTWIPIHWNVFFISPAHTGLCLYT